MSAHARLSPSAASRWMTCPGSVALTEHLPDQTSIYAHIGTLIHAVCELALIKEVDVAELPLDGEFADLTNEHLTLAQEYVDYVRSLSGERKVEVRMRFNDDLWGTSDAVVFDGTTLHVADLKTGSGVPVEAVENDQLRIYALMAFEEFEFIEGPFEQVVCHIVQPALRNYSTWTISAADLRQWRDEVLLPAIDKALSPDAPIVPSDKACRWCKARFTCRERAKVNLSVAQAEFGGTPPSANELSLYEIADLLPRLDELISWAEDVREYAYTQAQNGVEIHGHKLVEGRSNRAYSSEEVAIAKFQSLGFKPEQYTTSKIIGITAAEKLLGAKKFAEEFADVLVKPAGKPVLVPDTDKRPAISGIASAVADFA